ncbi:unnamed protein product, partial [Musa acuminata var. zebrina]
MTHQSLQNNQTQWVPLLSCLAWEIWHRRRSSIPSLGIVDGTCATVITVLQRCLRGAVSQFQGRQREEE